MFGKVNPKAIKYRFRIENRPSSLADSGGNAPPPIGAHIWEYSIGERVNKGWNLGHPIVYYALNTHQICVKYGHHLMSYS